MLSREQYYLDILFSNYPSCALNRAPIAGSTLGFKNDLESRLARTGPLNPMYGKVKSIEFTAMQYRDKSGPNNPQFGVTKSAETIAKLTKLVFVYDSSNMSPVGNPLGYSTVNCAKVFGIGKDTLTKYLANGLPFKGNLYRRTKV
jgi:hypothetical protein